VSWYSCYERHSARTGSLLRSNSLATLYGPYAALIDGAYNMPEMVRTE